MTVSRIILMTLCLTVNSYCLKKFDEWIMKFRMKYDKLLSCVIMKLNVVKLGNRAQRNSTGNALCKHLVKHLVHAFLFKKIPNIK